MSYTLTQQTTVTVYVVIQDETGTLAISLQLITGLFAFLWQIRQGVASFRNELAMLIRDVKAALDFTGKVLSICLVSLAFGLGLTK